jgi:RNA polymerase sigma-70 factor (ECF subfamily)
MPDKAERVIGINTGRTGQHNNVRGARAGFAELMRRAQEGDRDAFRVLLEEITPILKAFLRKRIADPAEIEDVCQEILLALYQGRHTYHPALSLEPWLFAIAHNIAADHARRSWQRARWQDLVASPPETIAEHGEEASDRLHFALLRLPDAQREAFTMLKLEGMSVAAAARKAGVTAGALRVRAHRAYEALKRLLAG